MPQPKKPKAPTPGLTKKPRFTIVKIVEGAVKVRPLRYGELDEIRSEIGSDAVSSDLFDAAALKANTAMVSRCAVEPELSEDDVNDLMPGSVMELVGAINELSGLDRSEAELEDAEFRRFPAQ